MFGSKSAFGNTSGFAPNNFGSPAPFGPSSSGFGTPAFGGPQTSTNGIFGNPSTTNAGVSLFGGSNTTAFSTNTTANSGFSAFGSNSNSLFGTSQPSSTSGLFSSPATNTAFGATKPAFGAFAGNTSTGSLFGNLNSNQTSQQTQQTTSGSLFGSSLSTGLFGVQPSSSFGGLSAAPSGTTIKFNPTTGTDTMVKNGLTQNINTRHQCITCMKEYENKSLEELRLEDHLANRKGPQAGSLSTGFGQQSQGLFGNSATSSSFTFGNNKPSFGASTSGAFGSTGSSLFGQQPSTNTLFGAPKPTFGAATTTTTTTTPFVFGSSPNSLFNQNNQPKPLFGQASTAQTGSLFGSTTNTQSAPLFGGGGFSFGASNNNQSTGLFGKPATLGGTNPSTTLSFTNPTNTGSSLFGSKSGPSLLGSGAGFGTGTSTFGSFGSTANQTGGGLFSKSTPAFGTGTLGTGLSNTFGTLNSGSSLFPNTLNKTTPGLGTTTSTGFGATGLNCAPGLGFGSTTGSVFGNDANNAALNAQQLQIQQQILTLTNSPFGDSPLFRNISQDSIKRDELLKPTNPAAQKALITPSHYKVSPLPTTKMKPKSLHAINGKSSLFDGLEDGESSFTNDTFVPRKSLKKLVLKNKSPLHLIGSPDMTLQSVEDDGQPEVTPSVCVDKIMSPFAVDGSVLNSSASSEVNTPSKDPIDSANQSSDSFNKIYNNPVSKPLAGIPSSVNLNFSQNLDDTIPMLFPKNKMSESSRSYQEQDDSEKENISRELSGIDHDFFSSKSLHATGIVLTRPGYYTIPSLNELAKLVDSDGNCFVENFTVGREGYGSAFFSGITNVANFNLDEIVHFRRKEITIYPDDDDKPPVGQGLNKKAQVTLDCVWPTDKSSHTPIKSPERLKLIKYQDKIELATAKIGAKFMEYRPETGSWVFLVQHFSKYGLQDSDEEDLPLPSEQAPPGQAIPQPPPKQNLEQTQPKQMLASTEQNLLSTTLREDDSEMADICQESFPKDFNYESPIDRICGDSNETSLHRLVQAIGTNSYRIKSMKESLFLDDDEAEAVYSKPSPAVKTDSPAFITYDYPLKPMLYSSLFSQEKSHKRKIPALTIPSFSSPQLFRLPHPAILPLSYPGKPVKLVGTRCNRGMVPLKDSLIFNNHRLISDAGCFMGRTCRVGWGPKWVFVHCGDTLSQKFHIEDGNDPGRALNILTIPHQPLVLNKSAFTVEFEKVIVAPHLIESEKSIIENLEACLEVHYKNSKSSCEFDCPEFVPVNGVETIQQFVQLVTQQLDNLRSHPDAQSLQHTKLVWELCSALYSNYFEFQEMSELEKSTSYAYLMARRESVSQWLAQASQEKIEREVQESKYQSNSHLQSVFSYLTGLQISKACKVSQEVGDHRTALLISHAMSSQRVNQLILQQLSDWEQIKADEYINPDRLKIYALLAGALVWPSSQNTLNACELLDWKRSFALHLWYHCLPTATIVEALQVYDKAFKGETPNGVYTNPPWPPYLEESADKWDNEDVEFPAYDTAYHLLQLYSQRSYPLENVLVPTASTCYQLDYRLSWLLSQVLYSLGYSHLSEYHWDCLHTNFAAQLEAINMWHWAAYILLHIRDVNRREVAVKELLCRHITLNREDWKKEECLINKFHIPKTWLHQAKALRAKYEQRNQDEAWHLLKAGFWNESHNKVVKSLAAEAIINENYDYLKSFLVELAPVERSSTVQDWSVRGQVFLDYIRMTEAVEDLKKETIGAYDLERLHPEIMSLSNRIGFLPSLTAMDRLCSAEMAKKIASLMQLVLHLQNKTLTSASSWAVPTRLMAPSLNKLPLPEDARLQELQILTRSYLLEMTA